MTRCGFYRQHRDATVMIEVGTRESAIRITVSEFDFALWGHWTGYSKQTGKVHPDLLGLYDYLKENGRVIHLTDSVAHQTIRYLKETN